MRFSPAGKVTGDILSDGFIMVLDINHNMINQYRTFQSITGDVIDD